MQFLNDYVVGSFHKECFLIIESYTFSCEIKDFRRNSYLVSAKCWAILRPRIATGCVCSRERDRSATPLSAINKQLIPGSTRGIYYDDVQPVIILDTEIFCIMRSYRFVAHRLENRGSSKMSWLAECFRLHRSRCTSPPPPLLFPPRPTRLLAAGTPCDAVDRSVVKRGGELWLTHLPLPILPGYAHYPL